MKITIEQAFLLEQVYMNLRDKPLPIKTAYKLSKLIKIVENEMQFYRDKLKVILDECAVKDENGQYIINDENTSVQLLPEKTEKCTELINDLQTIELEVDLNTKFTLEELEGMQLSLQDIAAFEPFIEE